MPGTWRPAARGPSCDELDRARDARTSGRMVRSNHASPSRPHGGTMRPVQILSAVMLTMLAAAPADAQTPPVANAKPGGVLRPVLREDLPQGFSIHESATNSVTWPAMPCYSNLVIFDQSKKVERQDTIVP